MKVVIRYVYANVVCVLIEQCFVYYCRGKGQAPTLDQTKVTEQRGRSGHPSHTAFNQLDGDTFYKDVMYIY